MWSELRFNVYNATMAKEIKFFKAPRYLLRKLNILNVVDQLQVKSFIDVGCGAGELACSLAERGYEGVGLDFSDEAIKCAKSIQKDRNISTKRLRFIKGNASQITSKSDLVICCAVIEHLKDDDAFLEEIKRSGEYFLFSVPARMKWFDRFDEMVGHYRRYEKDELTKQLNQHGYEVMDFMSYGYPYINITRLVRKAMAGKVKPQDKIEDKTKQSGVNPIETLKIQSLDIEPPMKLLYWLSKPFNRYNLSEGYLVLCRLSRS